MRLPSIRYNLAETCPVGVLGDPTKASAQAGLALQGAANAVYVELVREALRAHEGTVSS